MKNTVASAVLMVMLACGANDEQLSSGKPVPPVTGAGGEDAGSAPPPAPSDAGDSGVRPCSASTLATSVVVDACSTRSESGRDDVANARAICRGASGPESNGGLDSTLPILQGVGFDRVRIINSQGESSVDDGGVFHPSARMGFGLGDVKRANMKLHLVVGQWRPQGFPDPATSWDATTWQRYEDFAYKLARHAAVEFDGTGFSDVLFEVGNEIDGTQSADDLWAVGAGTPQADDKRYVGYLSVYRVWQKAVDRVAKENPTRTIGIAGPAFSGTFFYGSTGNWLERFVDDVAKEGMRLDALTFHFYGDFENGLANAPVPNSAIAPRLAGIRSHLATAGRASTQILVTEWGPSDNTSWSDGVAPEAQPAFINFGHPSAAWTAAFMATAASAGVTGGALLGVRDNFGADRTMGTLPLPSFAHVRNDLEYPKPIAHACKMFTMLPGTRVDAKVKGKPHVGAFASASPTSAAVVVYNYAFAFGTNTDDSTAQTIDVGFSNLPFSGPATVERFLVDQTTSNLLTELATAAPNPANVALAKVDSLDVNVTDGALSLDARPLGKSAVTLWRVTKK